MGQGPAWCPQLSSGPQTPQGPWDHGCWGERRVSPSQAVVHVCAHAYQTCLPVLTVLALRRFKEKQGGSGPADSPGVPPTQHRGHPVAGPSRRHRSSPWGGLAWTCLSCRDPLLLVALCSALARGLIIRWIPALVPEKARKQARSNPLHTPLDPEAASEVRAAVEVQPGRGAVRGGRLRK